MLRASLLKGSPAMPGWQVAWMWLGGFKSHLTVEALWVLMHVGGTSAVTLRHIV